RVGIATYHAGEDRGIGNSQCLNAMDAQLRIHNSRIGIRAHSAGAAGMMDRCGSSADILDEPGVILYLRTRLDLSRAVARKRGSLRNPPADLQATQHRGEIIRVAE